MNIQHLFISPGHNFFGHHGEEAGKNPLDEVREIECVAGHGIRGDRFFDYKEDYKGQITFFSSEVFHDVCRVLTAGEKSPGVARRNVVTQGIDLNSLVGEEFLVQGIDFEGVCECRPCYGGSGHRARRGRSFARPWRVTRTNPQQRHPPYRLNASDLRCGGFQCVSCCHA